MNNSCENMLLEFVAFMLYFIELIDILFRFFFCIPPEFFELFPERYVKRADSHAMEATESLVIL